MRRLLHSIFEEWRAGRRGAFFFMGNRVWAGASGLILVALVAATLSPEAQGFFFTFWALLLMQQLVELGFGVVLTQFVSHEWAHLELRADDTVHGSPAARDALARLVRLSVRWYACVSIAVIALLGVGGFLFMRAQGDTSVDWELAWWLLIGCQAVYALGVPLSAILEGADNVHGNQRSLLLGNLVGYPAGWIVLLAGGGLYALPVLVGLRALVTLGLLARLARPFLRLRPAKNAADWDWRHQFWPQQWRIALSWMAGFLMFQSFTPVAFQVLGPAEAGEVGFMVQIYLSTLSLGQAWVIAAQPQMGQLAARDEIAGLVELVERTRKKALATAAGVAAAAIALVTAVTVVAPDYGDRFGPLGAIILFALAAVPMQVSNAETAAVRFRKREPFVVPSLVFGALVLASNILLGTYWGTVGIAVGFTLVTCGLVVPWQHRIYRADMQTS